MYTFNKMWGVVTPAEARAKLDEQIAMGKVDEPKNLEEQAISLIGPDIYNKLVKGYTEKQWGRKATELPAFIIKRLPVRLTYDNNYFNDNYQGIPIGGYTQIVEKLLEGIPVKLGTDFKKAVKEVPAANGGSTVFEMDGDTFEKVLYTGMVDEFFDDCYGPLEYRSLRFESEELPDVDNFQGNAVVNYTEREVPFTRIIEHKFFEFGKDSETGEPIKGTIITREYPATWEKGMEPYYPVNNDKNNAAYERYHELALEKKNVLFGGRLGLYKYFDMDKVIRASLDAAAEELGK
jgi:UDP-galactopyranose mutase